MEEEEEHLIYQEGMEVEVLQDGREGVGEAEERHCLNVHQTVVEVEVEEEEQGHH